MAQRLISILMKIGIIAEETVPQRRLTGKLKAVASMMAVLFSGFFLYTSYFGPPASEYYRGGYILGTAVLCLLFYQGRQKPGPIGMVYLDELFNLIARGMMGYFLALTAYHYAAYPGALPDWPVFATPRAHFIGALGAAAALFLYWRETVREVDERFTLTDILYLIGSIWALIWWMVMNPELQALVGGPVAALLVMSAGLITAVSIEIARRIVGPLIPCIGFLFMLYTFEPFAQLSPGLLNHQGFPFERVAEFLLLSSSGLTGLIIEVFANFIVIFVILGAFLEKTGLGSLFIDFTFRVTGKLTGGPGLTAVVSSGLFGMISGSGVANVVTTGTFTIPLMKRVGYKPEFAAAVEAAASTGGAYMPPIMGAAAFVLAQFTETSYFDIVKIAAIPAVLYYLSVGYIVYVRAYRRGLHGVSESDLPLWSRILPRLHLLLPIPVMTYYLVLGDSPFLAAFKAILLILLLKISELLADIRTPWTAVLWRPFVGISAAFGVYAYYFGMQTGFPFTWVNDPSRGINIADALNWMLFGYCFLKLGALIAAALFKPEAPASAQDEGFKTGAAVAASLKDAGKELVQATWLSLEGGGKSSIIVGCIAGVLGILLSCATQSDLAGRVSALLVQFSFGLLPLTIFWVILAGYIVGMGLPITASYVVLVIFSALALIDLGVPKVTAHLILFWLAVVSAVTPPVALAAYAAASIASSDPVKTGFQATKLASWMFIMPFLFVYTPLLLNGTLPDILITIAACVVGIVTWGSFMEGFLIRYTTGIERAMLIIASVCLLLPADHLITWLTPAEWVFHHYPFYAAGVILLAAVYLMQRKRPADVGNSIHPETPRPEAVKTTV